ncbi:VOC family protein [Dietzia timorensis]|uniref:VOC family protein n=1 Tax=Dietzia timorensis TaxID=499555 RepID=UPI00082BB15E|nr:VOC family protein [Dietzia timorensis]
MSGDIVFFDLPGKNAEKTAHFWETLFGWKFKEGNFSGYSMIEGSSPMGGSAHGDEADFLTVYFSVDSLDSALEKVRELGGKVEEPVKIPAGRFANCADDQGVRFSLFEAGQH